MKLRFAALRLHRAHFEELDQCFASLEQAVAFQEGLFLQRVQVLGNRVDEIGIRNVFRHRFILYFGAAAAR